MKVFLNYTNKDESLARRVADVLNKAGLEVWDDREILPGDNWADKIAHALNESNAMVALLSPEALNSNRVRYNIEYALGEKGYSKRLLPVLVGSSEIIKQKNFPWILRHLNIIQLPEPGKEEEGLGLIAQTLLDFSNDSL